MSEMEQVNEEEQEGVYLDELEYSESDDDEESEEVETIDVTNEPLYHILSAFLEDEEGANLIDKIGELTSAIKTNTKVMSKLLKGMTSK
jgi:altronate dehydratase